MGLEVAQETSFGRFGLGLDQTDLSRTELIVGAQGGAPAAFQELVRSYDVMVMRVALALTSSEDSAQDIYCQVFRDAFASLGKLDSDSSVFVWLYRILVKHCIEYCRHDRRAVPGCAVRSGPPTVAHVLCTLPPTERVIFLLKHFQGLKIRTLAEIFQCSQERIASVLQTATISLRARLRLPHHQAV
jgi:RNA polymerase sigma-70 factor (ECF subfamily)